MADTFNEGTITDVALSAQFVSKWFAPGPYVNVLSIHVKIANVNAVGEVKFQGANIPGTALTDGLDISFIDNTGARVISLPVTSAVAFNDGAAIWPVAFRFYRVIYLYTSGGASNLLTAEAEARGTTD
jgi:hypothetical protein